MAIKCESSNAGKSGMPGKPRVLPLIQKAQVLRGRKENGCAEAAQGYGGNKLLSGNSGRREKNLTGVLLCYTSNCKSYHHRGRCCIKMETHSIKFGTLLSS